MYTLPGLIDPHVHVRDPGATHKEDWDTATRAALAGGFTAVLAMPNTAPPVFDADTLRRALRAARRKARCDYAQYLGAGAGNAAVAARLLPQSAALKMYLDSTFGELRLDDMTLWMEHFRRWRGPAPIVVHAESRSMAAALALSRIFDVPVHIAHVSLREEILLIRAAKERGVRVTCEATPHHLFLTAADIPSIARGRPGRGEVRPRLASRRDVDALWAHLDVIDCFATDHAPHTLVEKDSASPPPGFPGLETALPLFLTALRAGRLTLAALVEKLYTNPRRIFRLPSQPRTFIEVDETARWEIRAADMHSRCGWTPFEGRQVTGRVRRVVLRGQTVFRDGKILAPPGFGRNLRPGTSP